MKKNFAAGLFAVSLIVAGGTGAYVAYAKENNVGTKAIMQQHGMDSHMIKLMNSSDMKEMMSSNNMIEMMNSKYMKEMQKIMQSKNNSFDQMLPLMKKMHPDLSNEQLKALYEKMHEKNGSTSCSNLKQGMMGNDNKVKK